MGLVVFDIGLPAASPADALLKVGLFLLRVRIPLGIFRGIAVSTALQTTTFWGDKKTRVSCPGSEIHEYMLKETSRGVEPVHLYGTKKISWGGYTFITRMYTD